MHEVYVGLPGMRQGNLPGHHLETKSPCSAAHTQISSQVQSNAWVVDVSFQVDHWDIAKD